VVPIALGSRTAGALSGLAETGLVVRLTRGRLWIGVLGALLVGIVALNVGALSFNAASSQVGRQADALDRENSALRARIANQLSNDSLQEAIYSLGLVAPEPAAVHYLHATPSAAEVAARRLASRELTSATSATTAVPVTTTPVPAPAPTPTTPVAP